MYSKLSTLIGNYHSQGNYPIAQGILLSQIDKETTKLESEHKNIKEAVYHLLFNF